LAQGQLARLRKNWVATGSGSSARKNKFGDEQGLTGADTVLLDGKPVNAGSLLAAQAEGHAVATIEALGEHPNKAGKRPMDCIRCKRLSSNRAPSNADTARPRKSSRRRVAREKSEPE
jgi:hypothetical protein